MLHKPNYNNQDGVALMLSVLILAAITAIAFSLATIVFIELRSSRDLLRSEPALYATLGVTEEALFQYKRYVNERTGGVIVNPPLLDVTTCTPMKDSVCLLGGVDLSSPPAELMVAEEVPKVVTVNANQTVEVPLFYIDNPECPVGDDVCQWTPPFDRIELQLVPIGATDASLSASVNWVNRDGDEGTPINLGSISEGDARLSWTGFQSLSRHQLVLRNNSASNNMQVSIWSYEDQGILEVEKGLPIIAKRVLKIVADYLGLTRTYRVEIPVGTSNFGSAPQVNDIVWVEDSIPGGSTPASDPDPWNWVSSNPAPQSGTLAHKSGVFSGIHQHYFTGSPTLFDVQSGDTLVQYVYLDPANMPRTIMVQWGSAAQGWNHRAYWGEDLIPWGINGTQSRRYMGPLPISGNWIRLEIPASQVGLEGAQIHSIAYTLYDGQVTWDHTGKEQ